MQDDPNATPEEDHNQTIKEFCKSERMSEATYVKLRSKGFGPTEMRFPGMTFVRITPQARREWHERNIERQKEQAAQLERERRSAQAKRLGKHAAESPEHWCRKKGEARKKAVRR